jgi:hypothetical protein
MANKSPARVVVYMLASPRRRLSLVTRFLCYLHACICRVRLSRGTEGQKPDSSSRGGGLNDARRRLARASMILARAKRASRGAQEGTLVPSHG